MCGEEFQEGGVRVMAGGARVQEGSRGVMVGGIGRGFTGCGEDDERDQKVLGWFRMWGEGADKVLIR